MANLSEDLADLTISRQLVLQRLANGLSKEVADHYEAMIDDIRTTILKSGVISNHLKQTINDIKEQLSVPNFDKEFKELAKQEVNYTQKAYNSVIGVDVFKNIPPESAMSSILSTSLIEGATISAWMQDLEASQAFDVERAIKMGMTLGETNNQLAQRVVNIMGVSMRNAQTIVKTGTATVANQARMEFMKANEEDVIKGYQWHATLDSRVRLEHAARDGAAWDTNKKGLNEKGKKYPFKYTPDGWNCRCQLTPILKTWREIGIDEDELPEGTRSSLDGYVPQTTTFDKWIEGKSDKFKEDYLGKGRYNLYKDGKITFSDLVRQDGRTLTIKELGEMSVGKAIKVPEKIIFTSKGGDKFDFVNYTSSSEAKTILSKIKQPKEIEIADSDSGSYYNPLLGKVTSARNHPTFMHEYGHHIDAQIGSFKLGYSSQRLKDAFIKDSFLYEDKDFDYFKKLLIDDLKYSESNKVFEICDTLTSMTEGFLHSKGVPGHNAEYWKRNGSKESEAFANMFSLWSKSNKKEWEVYKSYFPSLSEEFEKTMEDLINDRI